MYFSSFRYLTFLYPTIPAGYSQNPLESRGEFSHTWGAGGGGTFFGFLDAATVDDVLEQNDAVLRKSRVASCCFSMGFRFRRLLI
jgi:hypothetical protein